MPNAAPAPVKPSHPLRTLEALLRDAARHAETKQVRE
jgi:hypothetical protein